MRYVLSKRDNSCWYFIYIFSDAHIPNLNTILYFYKKGYCFSRKTIEIIFSMIYLRIYSYLIKCHF
ncbi:hypothetical protein J3Q64DRAFT_1748791, partial [Phycomyces blakesleeanus]